jgi:hypothetical protein
VKTASWYVLWLGFMVVVLPYDLWIHGLTWSNPRGALHGVLTANDYLSGYPVPLLVLFILLSQLNRRKLITVYLAVMTGHGLFVDPIKVIMGRGLPLMRGRHFISYVVFAGGIGVVVTSNTVC